MAGPMLLLTSAVFFTLATVTRSMAWVFVAERQQGTLKRLRLQVRDVMNPQRQNNPRRPNADAFRPNMRRP